MIGRSEGFLDAKASKVLEIEAKEFSKMMWGLIKHYGKD